MSLRRRRKARWWGVVEAEDADPVLAGGVELLAVDLGHLEQLAQAVAEALRRSGSSAKPESSRWVGKTVRPGSSSPVSAISV